MRIAHVTATFPPYQGGTGNVCYYNARELARLGHEVHVFTADHPEAPTTEVHEGYTIHRLSALFRIGNAPFIPGLLGIKNFDIIHLHHLFIFGAEMVWLAAKFRGIPYVLTHHNDLIGKGTRRYLFDAYFFISPRLLFVNAAKLAVVSKDHATHCRLTPLFRQRWSDVVEVPNGVDIKTFRPDIAKMVVRKHFQITVREKIILFVGALDRAHHFKGVEYLIDTFTKLNNPETILMIIGDGDLKDAMVNRANSSGVRQRIIFTGSVPNNELPPFYVAADVLVLPSSPPESFGMVLIEAMACGTPVIAHDIPGVRSVIDHGMDGFLVELGNQYDLIEKLSFLLDMSPSKREEMGKFGRRKVERKYTWKLAGERLEEVYRNVLAPQDSRHVLAEGQDEG